MVKNNLRSLRVAVVLWRADVTTKQVTQKLVEMRVSDSQYRYKFHWRFTFDVNSFEADAASMEVDGTGTG